jgi:hypothetical protein
LDILACVLHFKNSPQRSPHRSTRTLWSLTMELLNCPW